MDAPSGAVVITYFCPICGIDLERSDFDKPLADYYCPFCSSQQAPAEATRRAGWGSPD